MDRVLDIVCGIVLLACTVQLARLWWRYLHPGPGIYTRWRTKSRLTLASTVLALLWVALAVVMI